MFIKATPTTMLSFARILQGRGRTTNEWNKIYGSDACTYTTHFLTPLTDPALATDSSCFTSSLALLATSSFSSLERSGEGMLAILLEASDQGKEGRDLGEGYILRMSRLCNKQSSETAQRA